MEQERRVCMNTSLITGELGKVEKDLLIPNSGASRLNTDEKASLV